MKKILYLIPIILLALSATHITLHKDTVNYKPGGGLTDLTPGHWKTKNYSIGASFSLSQAASADTSKALEAYSQNAKFNGFPFGYYFSKSSTSSISSLEISAYSWLWATVDGLIIVLALAVAFLFNRPKKAEPQPLANPTPPSPVYPPGS